ncbi:MAG TPA: hypothetical protein EYP55_09385 [Anaerolineae bacterium]|nr:hypothetical protein [Anaerolineae bacterium]
MSLGEGKYASFFIRLWQEPRERGGEPPEWRGSIEHVQSRKKRYFKDVETVIAFIQEMTNNLRAPSGRRRYIA